MKWFDNLMRKKREPRAWQWSCFECTARGTGTQEKVERDSTTHLFLHGHTVKGGEA